MTFQLISGPSLSAARMCITEIIIQKFHCFSHLIFLIFIHGAFRLVGVGIAPFASIAVPYIDDVAPEAQVNFVSKLYCALVLMSL